MSSYNDFLSKIEVDEKELKRDLQNRKNEKRNPNLKASSMPNKKPNGSKSLQKLPTKSENRGNTPENSKKVSDNKTKMVTKPQSKGEKPVVDRPSSRSVEKRPINEKNKNINNNRQQVVGKSSVKAVPVNSTKPVRTSEHRPNVRKNNPNLTRARLKKDSVHLRQKKAVDQLTKDKALVEKVTFKISKDEYDKKVLGTVSQQQTKMIFLRDGQRLAKVPLSVGLLGLYAFMLSVIMLYSFSRVGTMKMELKKLNSELAALTDVNAQLDIKLATAYNIDNIRQRAENELYMSKPETHQIMYITVVPENNVEYGEMETNDEQ